MAQRDLADDRERGIESKFYLPAGVTPASEAGWIESIRTILFDRRV
jgi:hypothetical protein